MLRRLWQRIFGRPYIKGVGILRYPVGNFLGEDGMIRSGAQLAMKLGCAIRPGTILLLPDSRDEHGSYLWNFKIEGGDPGQVEIQRQPSL